MSLLMQITVPLPQGTRPALTSWSSSHGLLAVACNTNDVVIVRDDGSPYSTNGIFSINTFASEQCSICLLQWHPIHRLLLVGTTAGQIFCWRDSHGLTSGVSAAKLVAELNSPHKSAVTRCVWNNAGHFAATSDDDGTVCLWHLQGGLADSPLILASKYLTLCAEACLCFEENYDAGKSHLGSAEATCTLFAGGTSGEIFKLHHDGTSAVVASVGTRILKLIYYARRTSLLVLSSSMSLAQYNVGAAESATATQTMKVKLSVSELAEGEEKYVEMLWVGAGHLAIAAHEKLIRLWDLERDETYVLNVRGFQSATTISVGSRRDPNIANDRSGSGGNLKDSQHVTAIAYDAVKRVLIAGTAGGEVIYWNYVGHVAQSDSAQSGQDKWVRVQEMECGRGDIVSIACGHSTAARTETVRDRLVFSICQKERACIVAESRAKTVLRDGIAVLQLSSQQILVRYMGPDDQVTNSDDVELPTEALADTAVASDAQVIDAGLQINSIDVTVNALVLRSSTKMEVYARNDRSKFSLVKSFSIETKDCAIHQDSIYIIPSTGGDSSNATVDVLNFQGVKKARIELSKDFEGYPVCLACRGNYLLVGTSNHYAVVYDIAGRAPQRLGGPRTIIDESMTSGDGRSQLRQMCVNERGSRVAFLFTSSDGGTSPNDKSYRHHLGVYYVEEDETVYMDCVDAVASALAQGRRSEASDVDVSGLSPVDICWDDNDSRLLCVHIAAGPSAAGISGARGSVGSGLLTLYSTMDKTLCVQDYVESTSQLHAILGVRTPHLCVAEKPDTSSLGLMSPSSRPRLTPVLRRRRMRDFAGMDIRDERTVEALRQFSYHSARGAMDDAYQAVKLMRSPLVWEHMALMCVRTRRLDVALVCLAHMGHARGAMAIRETMEREEDPDVALAMLAVQLGLLEDAERLYKKCGRYDLLNTLLQAQGRWDLAMSTADADDRVHLRTTRFLHGKHLEAMGDVDDAVSAYELSNTHRRQVPRMLFDQPDGDRKLKDYVDASNDAMLFRWWAQYLESNSKYDEALTYYSKAQDVFSQVRLLCFMGNVESAIEVTNESKNKAAAYLLARQFEHGGQSDDAIKFYCQSGQFTHALRIAIDEGRGADAERLAIQSNDVNTMLEAARDLERHGHPSEAVRLLSKCGYAGRALQLCFRFELFDTLSELAAQVVDGNGGSAVDAKTMEKCAVFFKSHQQYDKAARLLVNAGRIEEALSLFETHSVPITEAIADTLTTMTEKYEKRVRRGLLSRLAELAMQQQLYHLAAKKFTQAGDKVRAMQALVRSRETAKIIFFANASRNRDVYLMAANFLETQDWRGDKDGKLLNHIIEFYTKAKALESLSGFYQNCAQLEIDEYRDYENALLALKEALKYLEQAKGVEDLGHKQRTLQRNIEVMESFINARERLHSGDAAAVSDLERICSMQGVELAVRLGDVFAVLVEYYQQTAQWDDAYSILDRMNGQGISLEYYVDGNVVKTVCEQAGRPTFAGGFGNEIEEDIAEVIDQEDF